MHPKARKFYLFLLFASLFSAIAYVYNVALSRPFSSLHPYFSSNLNSGHKYAYATFLGPPTSKDGSDTDPLKDPYFTSVRLLNYQIQHAERTKTRLNKVPFLVLVLPKVRKNQIKTLKSEGATIVTVKPLDLPDYFDKTYILNSRFRDVLSKLRLWQLTDYDKVLYLDADSFLLQNLDGIFTNLTLSAPQKTLPSNRTEGDERSLFPPPDEYLMSASADTYGDQTEWEKPGHENYFCACFMLLAPSEVLFNYYLYVLAGGDALKNAAYPEQDLLIWVHRENGQMPWRRIPIEWSANDGEMNDEIEGGVKSLHVKAWEGAMQTKEVGNAANEKTRKMWRELIKEMEEYYRLGSLT